MRLDVAMDGYGARNGLYILGLVHAAVITLAWGFAGNMSTS
jgi:hypothetical protein